MNIHLGGEEETLKELEGVNGVTERHALYGTYDIIVKVEADTMERVREIIQKKMRHLDKVESTLTMIVAK